MNPGERLKAAREAQGMTQTELAQAIGLSLTGVGKIERGERALTAEVAMRAAVATGVSVVSLLPDQPWRKALDPG